MTLSVGTLILILNTTMLIVNATVTSIQSSIIMKAVKNNDKVR
ncbi:hypothetical protein BH753_gp024 [Bacillus phage Shbh1]|uniref:Uncharacterized protein n=1 Tax=Bacillus phage Shbh1 TaxID=1796992 RepID=A0A142F149_9CAUD|nr:hypothetical protein BH753_gp024 [Bacillus phage Shbh1]AMQ66506.1 hypothetical protein [Bacillus phage Shbh1]